MFHILAPSAISPPSAKSRHWMVSTTIMDRNPAYGPSSAESIMPPHICPEEPVPGIV